MKQKEKRSNRNPLYQYVISTDGLISLRGMAKPRHVEVQLWTHDFKLQNGVRHVRLLFGYIPSWLAFNVTIVRPDGPMQPIRISNVTVSMVPSDPALVHWTNPPPSFGKETMEKAKNTLADLRRWIRRWKPPTGARGKLKIVVLMASEIDKHLTLERQILGQRGKIRSSAGVPIPFKVKRARIDLNHAFKKKLHTKLSPLIGSLDDPNDLTKVLSRWLRVQKWHMGQALSRVL